MVILPLKIGIHKVLYSYDYCSNQIRKYVTNVLSSTYYHVEHQNKHPTSIIIQRRIVVDFNNLNINDCEMLAK